MSIPRIYQNTFIDQQVTLSAQAMQHVVKVLRLGTGASIILFNGDNHEYHGELIIQDKRSACVQIHKRIFVDRESPLQIHLAQGIARGEKMDGIIQKAVELGVHEITPLFTQRCNVKLTSDRVEKRWAHWQQIAISAAEQCGRNRITSIHAPMELSHFLVDAVGAQKWILAPGAICSLKSFSVEHGSCLLIVGPEGGFAAEELALAQAQAITPVSLGPRILRTETAALVAVSILQAQAGDL